MADKAEKRNVYISLHKLYVREGIEYADPATGEAKSFNMATLPRGTVIDGKDVSGYQFSPLYVNPSRFKGEDWRDIPLLADREVWLQKSVLDPEGNPVIGEDGRRQRDTIVVTPQQIKDAIAESRRAWLAEHSRDDRGLADRAQQARHASEAASKEAPERPLSRDAARG
ncbi:Uncharacterised protein [Slackia heliotrinireducens]|uniref:DNA gyrase n=1 Tax=Slackia heliotrinireducens (strain ATCC 29202 / DSM 20476 / NCTC 11029 / RHS 1) TaxID=471855 RepID=C7N7M9_SLAHD|nr:hypothetical protein [Slackia heliotrinireducens]ACV22914.1 hypothetical protein Shel_18980 [Slackia heliotrinireducens DSM 20476]VEH01722.1 Uncharacterised protein [Slackia heliotrinireducens]